MDRTEWTRKIGRSLRRKWALVQIGGRAVRSRLSAGARRGKERLARFVRRMPGVKVLWKKYGYYATVAVLVTCLSVGAYFYRNRPVEAVPVMASAPVAATPAPVRTVFLMPLSGQVTAEYANETPVFTRELKSWSLHEGIDIAPDGDDTVHAMAVGQVEEVYEDSLMGWVVEIEHEGGYRSRYASLDEVYVAPGDRVTTRSTIGRAGDSAVGEPTGEHVHVEVSLNGEAIDPMTVIEGA